MLKTNKFNTTIFILTLMAMVITMSEAFAVDQISN